MATHLMFQGRAAEALDFYATVFPGFVVEHVETYEQNGKGGARQIKRADVNFEGHALVIIDSPISHDFDFTASVSLFADFSSEDVLRDSFDRLSEGGQVLMPLDDYGFSRVFGWVADRFGVSWQLNLE